MAQQSLFNHHGEHLAGLTCGRYISILSHLFDVYLYTDLPAVCCTALEHLTALSGSPPSGHPACCEWQLPSADAAAWNHAGGLAPISRHRSPHAQHLSVQHGLCLVKGVCYIGTRRETSPDNLSRQPVRCNTQPHGLSAVGHSAPSIQHAGLMQQAVYRRAALPFPITPT